MLAPYGEGQLEAHGEYAGGDFGGACAKRVRCGVEGGRVDGVGWVVPTHIEALHGSGGDMEACAACVVGGELRVGDGKGGVEEDRWP